MQLDDGLWIADGYYVDFDQLGQFRVIGPNNHLYCGLVDIPRHRLAITAVTAPTESSGAITGRFLGPRINLYYPAMDDIRTVRALTGTKTFLQVRQEQPDRLVPQQVSRARSAGKTQLTFVRAYGRRRWYRATLSFPPSVTVTKIARPFAGFRLATLGAAIPFTLTAETNDLPERPLVRRYFLQDAAELPFERLGRHAGTIRKFWRRTEVEITHLIRWGKTSGDRFGTIFPRDWMETADLGVHDLTPEIRSYLYEASLRHVNAKGEGWHEDVVGEFKEEYRIAGRDLYDRHMIDIEPHCLLGLDRLPDDFLLRPLVRRTLPRVARLVLDRARRQEFITFKKLPRGRGHASSGNWRDSEWAFKKVAPDLAPFDVNAVFYPEALAALKKFQPALRLHAPDLDRLIAKWRAKEKCFRFTNPDGLLAYALAAFGLRGKGAKLRYQQFKVNHLDESYLYTYGAADGQHIASFCRRLLDPAYFYTPFGPLITAANNPAGYTDREYHGQVIWMKQAAFTMLGLSKHLKRAVAERWPQELPPLIKTAMLAVAGGVIDACLKLNAIPELHWVDGGQPKFFPVSSSKVQLWSAVGFRRIIRKYLELLTHPVYRTIQTSRHGER